MKVIQHKVLILLVFACLSTTIGKSQALTVWPGDANNNGHVNHFDLIHVALGLGETGPARDSLSSAWLPQFLQTPWSQTLPGFPNMGYADCDGSGEIDFDDIATLQQNYGFFVGGFLGSDSSTLVTSGAPLISINIVPDSLPVNGSVHMVIEIYIGSPALAVDSICAMAFSVSYDTMLIDSVLSFTPGAFFAFDSSSVSLFNVNASSGLIEVGIARTVSSNLSGSGLLGTIVVALDDNIRVASNFVAEFGIAEAAAFTLSGSPVLLSQEPDSVEVITVGQDPVQGIDMKVYPVPASESLHLVGPDLDNARIRVVDLQGRVRKDLFLPNMNDYQLDIRDLTDGVYLLEVATSQGRHRTKFVVRAIN